MSYPTAFLNKEKPEKTQVIVTDAQIIGGKYMVQTEGAFNGWMRFWYLNFHERTSFQDLINGIQETERHEYVRELEEMRVS